MICKNEIEKIICDENNEKLQKARNQIDDKIKKQYGKTTRILVE